MNAFHYLCCTMGNFLGRTSGQESVTLGTSGLAPSDGKWNFTVRVKDA